MQFRLIIVLMDRLFQLTALRAKRARRAPGTPLHLFSQVFCLERRLCPDSIGDCEFLCDRT
jgi:hypothetical protein